MPSSEERARHWARIPDDVDVLVTHGPPRRILDLSPGQHEHAGDPELMSRVKELTSLRLHCFGHIHGGYGMLEQDGVLFVNAALMGHIPILDMATARIPSHDLSALRVLCTRRFNKSSST